MVEQHPPLTSCSLTVSLRLSVIKSTMLRTMLYRGNVPVTSENFATVFITLSTAQSQM